jgi:hypothetical protein
VVSALDRLDLAAYALTRVGGFTDRTPPTAADIEDWLSKRDPAWRQGPRDHAKLVELCKNESGLPFGIDNLLAAAGELLKLTANGWRLANGGPVNTIVRWRLPLGTIHAAAAAKKNHTRAGSPPTTSAAQDFDLALLREGAVDGHVHIGTCLPFDALFQLIQARSRTSATAYSGVLRTEAEEMQDSVGGTFEPATVLTMGAILSGLLDRFLAQGENDFVAFVASLPQTQSFKDAVLQGTLWEFLLEEDEAQPTRSRRIDSGFDLIEGKETTSLPSIDDPYEAAVSRKLALLKLTMDESAASGLLLCVDDLLRAEALVHSSLTQSVDRGLSAFLSYSHRLGSLRRSLPDQSRIVVKHGLPHLARGMWLRGVELRTAEQFAGHSGMADLARSLDAKLGGYEDALSGIEERKPMATWPICLIKDKSVVASPEQPASSLEGRVRFELRRLYDIVGQAAELLTTFPRARRVIPGLDVAGDENAVPNWCFAVLFREFLNRISDAEPTEEIPGFLSFRVHAGEDFHSPLQGLRRIYEAANWVVPEEFTPRLGHALALSETTPVPSLDSPEAQTIDEAFDDLVWAWSLLEQRPGAQNARLTRVLAEVIEAAGAELYEVEDAAISDYSLAYKNRFEHQALKELGLFVRSTYRERLELSHQVRLPGHPRTEQRILYRYLTDQSLAAAAKARLLDPAWLQQVIDAVRPLVIDAVRARGCVIESCPTSNLIIGGIDDYRRHPIHEWIAAGLSVTINTDDPGLFSINLQDEYASIWASSDPSIRLAQLKQVREKSLEMIESCATSEESLEAVETLRVEFASAGVSSD